MSQNQQEAKPNAVKKAVLFMRLSKFLYVFDLRQGAILIAVQHIALSACALILLLVGIAHAQEMMDILNADMEDNAEREGTILIDEQDLLLFREAPVEATNNQQKFKVAQNLAMMMVIFLYGSLVGTAVYLVFCMALFYGAAKSKREYMMPWAFLAVLAMVLLAGALILGDKSTTLTKLCGGHTPYRVISAFLIIGHSYCILAVTSYIYELSTVCNKLHDGDPKIRLSPVQRIITRSSIKIHLNPNQADAHLV